MGIMWPTGVTAIKKEQPQASFVLKMELLGPGEISGEAVG